MKPPRPWTVLPHGPLRTLEPNLKVVDGTLPKGNMPRTMMVARRADGRLVFHNAVPLDDRSMAELEAFGTPGFLVVPNGYHRLDLHAFKQRYPALQVVAPAAQASKVAEVVPVDLSYEQFDPDPDVQLVTVRGTRIGEGVMVVRSGGRASFCFGDLMMNLVSVKGLDGLLFKLLGSVGGPRVTLIAKLMVIGDKASVKAHLLELAQTPGLARLVPSHGEVIEADAPGVLRAVAGQL